MNGNIDGKVIVITGTSSGLGLAAARLLATQGARVVLGARRIDRLRQVAEELNASGQRALAVATDVTSAGDVKRLVDAAVETFGRVDVMVNNAGIMPQAPLARLRVEEWGRTIAVNLNGVLHGIAAALPHMQRQMSGQIVNVCSTAGHKVMLNGAVYSATKHAVRALSEGLRQEVKDWNIRTTVISPGMVDTELPASTSESDMVARLHELYRSIALPAESFARALAFAIAQPEDMDVNEIVFRPIRQVP